METNNSNNQTSNRMFNDAKNLNTITFNDYFNRLKLLTLSLFEWENMPETVSIKFLEETLFSDGKSIFIYDDVYGYLALKCNAQGALNFYNEPIQYNAYSTGYNKNYDADKCVIIRNNYNQMPTTNTLSLFAYRLSEVERTIDVNIKAQKTPIIVICSEKDRLTMKNLYMQYDGNYPFIFGDKNMNIDGMKVLQTEAPYKADKLSIYKSRLWNEALTFLGINNTNNEKRERLIVDEVEANNEHIEMSAQTMLLTRQEACTQINKMFGLNISVKLRTYYIRYLQENEVNNE